MYSWQDGSVWVYIHCGIFIRIYAWLSMCVLQVHGYKLVHWFFHWCCYSLYYNQVLIILSWNSHYCNIPFPTVILACIQTTQLGFVRTGTKLARTDPCLIHNLVYLASKLHLLWPLHSKLPCFYSHAFRSVYTCSLIAASIFTSHFRNRLLPPPPPPFSHAFFN